MGGKDPPLENLRGGMNWEPTSCSPIAPQGQKGYTMCGHLKAVLAFFVVIAASFVWFGIAVSLAVVLLALGASWAGVLGGLFAWVVAGVPAAATLWDWFERQLWA